MQIVIAKELVMDSSHGLLLSELPIAAGEKFTVIVLKEDQLIGQPQTERRKAYAHRFPVDDIALPARDDLYER
jgi:hypothetical protein